MSTISSKSLRITLSENSGWQVFAFDGAVDESLAELRPKLTEIQASGYMIDCIKITSINSCGIAELSELIDKLKESGKVLLDRCTPQIVTILNMIPGLSEGIYVRSLFRVYTCDKGHQNNVLTAVNLKNPSSEPKAPSIPACSKCSGSLSPMLDTDEECAFLEYLEAM